ncbi:MAG: GNAT family N-acetyltransferase [Archangium sp.]|nr:GNAT family N-acetyltransferase [Archangium sp.]MDP3155988.1 GNAT family N-acetyltransferase [Archangium sp.]MDP3576116.1 GNAT family N-acetyltransferase [Archangium sp.]
MTQQLRFETLAAAHKRDDFTCGNQALDQWFHTRASQDQKRHVAQVFVALRDDRIVGFYSLSMFTLALDSLPAALARKLPKYDAIPAAIIGRLARAESERGQGMGGLLVADAIKRVLAASESVAAYAIVVDAKDDAAKHFYEGFGFIPLASQPHRLFLLTQTAAAGLAAAERR